MKRGGREREREEFFLFLFCCYSVSSLSEFGFVLSRRDLPFSCFFSFARRRRRCHRRRRKRRRRGRRRNRHPPPPPDARGPVQLRAPPLERRDHPRHHVVEEHAREVPVDRGTELEADAERDPGRPRRERPLREPPAAVEVAEERGARGGGEDLGGRGEGDEGGVAVEKRRVESGAWGKKRGGKRRGEER